MKTTSRPPFLGTSLLLFSLTASCITPPTPPNTSNNSSTSDMSPSVDMAEPVSDAGEDVEMSASEDMPGEDMQEVDLAVCSKGEARCTGNQDGIEVCREDGGGFEASGSCMGGMLCDPETVMCREPCELSPDIACGVERLLSLGALGSECLGASLAVNGDTSFAGDPCYASSMAGEEGALFYEGSGFEARLPLTGAVDSSARYGTALATLDNWTFIGVPGASNGRFEQAGDVHVISLETDGQIRSECNMTPPEPHEDGYFGASIATIPSMDLVLIGEPGHPADSNPMGAVHVYRFKNCSDFDTEPSLTIRLPDSLAGPSSPVNFGASIAAIAMTDGGDPTARVLVGAPGDAAVSAVYKFELADDEALEVTSVKSLFLDSQEMMSEGLGASVKLDSTGSIGLVESRNTSGERALYSIYFDDLTPRLALRESMGGAYIASAFGVGDKVWIASGDPDDPTQPLRLSLHTPRPLTWSTERTILASECRATDMTPPIYPLALLESNGGDSLIVGCPMHREDGTPTGAVFRYDFAPATQ